MGIETSLSPLEARRVALAAQGFGAARPAQVGRAELVALARRLGLHQIDSVNVLTRAHALPAFSRLGAYAAGHLEEAAWGAPPARAFFEYWAHEASLLPLELHPLLRWRMGRADRGEAGYPALRALARERRPEAMRLLERLRAEGPLAASDFETGRAGWWDWSEAKRALEWLFYAGHVATAARRRNFERVYDLTERVIPAEILTLPTPTEAEAHRRLIAIAARALGIATAGELRDYFRLGLAETKAAVADLAEAGVLIPAKVGGWPAAWLHHEAEIPQGPLQSRALLAPFDPLIWERARAERLFGFRYRIEIYVPAPKRRYGYYVLPFLLGESLVARADLKADRKAGLLRAPAIHLEPGAPPETREALQEELRLMAGWLGLAGVAAEA